MFWPFCWKRSRRILWTSQSQASFPTCRSAASKKFRTFANKSQELCSLKSLFRTFASRGRWTLFLIQQVDFILIWYNLGDNRKSNRKNLGDNNIRGRIYNSDSPSPTPAESNLQTTTVECQCDDVGYYISWVSFDELKTYHIYYISYILGK